MVVLRDGIIEAVGADVPVPTDARRWDLTGKTIYPGLIDAYGHVSVETLPQDRGTPYWNPHVQPQRRVGELANLSDDRAAAYRAQGITVRLLAPDAGIIRGQGVVLTTADRPANGRVLNPAAALHSRLAAPRSRSRDQYPNSPMGAVALARQTFYDAIWYREALQAVRSQPGLAAPEQNTALEALQPYLNEQQLVLIETPDEQYLLRAERFAREFGLRVAFVGSGHEFRRLDAIRDTGRTMIVPLNFPKPPQVATADAAAEATLERLMEWDLAPENAGRLQRAGVPIALTAHGLDKPADFLPALRRAVKRGLDPVAALEALTVFPARLLGIQDIVGTLERGKRAHLVVTDGDLFESKTRIEQTWVDGQLDEFHRRPDLDLRGRWQITTRGDDSRPVLRLKGEISRLQGEWEPAAPPVDTTEPAKSATEGQTADAPKEPDDAPKEAEADKPPKIEEPKPAGERTEEGEAGKDRPKPIKLEKIQLRDLQLTAQFAAKAWGDGEGIAQLSAVIVPAEGEGWKLIGQVTRPNASVVQFVATRLPPSDEDHEEQSEDEAAPEDDEAPQADQPSEGDPTEDEAAKDDAAEDDPSSPESGQVATDGSDPAEAEKSTVEQASSFPVNYPLGAFGWTEAPAQPEWLLFRQATVWTCGAEGILDRADVLVHQGRIERVAVTIDEYPSETVVVACEGRHLTPGIIDCHSHMATDGGVNEGTQAITSEVRIGDFIDGRDVSIYRQLAGGVTTANILHGSANPIGGQNQVIKLRWGSLPEEMKFAEAPGGIKFALGENVKQSNWGDGYRSRYPQSRMGVEQIVRDAFLAAREYRQRHQQWQQTRRGLPPRVDLELEALAEVQDGTRWIHCHSYRQDEILALLRTLESLNIQIGTLQHILEGYKVAEAIKQHGAMASSFSDWWAYKIEVYDAIPFNGALMHHLGIVVSFNSDDAELARHLNHEAAKAVKYGGVAPAEALKFVTLNPARQLRIDRYVGSIEPGKHADLVLWSGSPLSNLSRCEQTWIDGKKYFDRSEDLKAQVTGRDMRTTLIQKILNSGQSMEDETQREPEERDLWPRIDIFCRTNDQR